MGEQDESAARQVARRTRVGWRSSQRAIRGARSWVIPGTHLQPTAVGHTVDETEVRRLLTQAQVAVLATVTPEGHPHVVPCCFVLDGDTIYSAVDDAKPKSTLTLRRLENVRANPDVSLLVHHYAEDWSGLWWVRVDGSGRIVEDELERGVALALLAAKYEQYRNAPPPGEVVAVRVERWRWWP